MTAAPTELRTERLVLRWLTEDDAGLLLEIWNDPEFIRHVGDRGIRTLEQARKAMREGVLELYRKYHYGPFLMFMPGDGAKLGICGLFKRDNLEDPDIGFGLLPGHRRKGYVYEAAEAVVEYAGSSLGLERLSAIVSPENTASVRLLEKLGMERRGPIRMPGEDEDILLYGLDLARQKQGTSNSPE
jgi:RimJ/RimL family protein N-acetyltransferase